MSDPRYGRCDINQTTWRQFGCFTAMPGAPMVRNCDSAATTALLFHRAAIFLRESGGLSGGFAICRGCRQSGSGLAEK
jgi:hypothetical protein